MIANFPDMIAGSLNLSEPWYVEGAEFSPEKKEVHIYVNVREGAEFAVLPAEVPLYAMDMSQQSVFGGMGTVCSTRPSSIASGPG